MLKEIIGTQFASLKISSETERLSARLYARINEIRQNKSFRANTCGIFNLEQYVTIYECCEVREQSSKY